MGRYIIQAPYSPHNRHVHTCMTCGETYYCSDVFCLGELRGARCSDCVRPPGMPLRQHLFQPYVFERDDDGDTPVLTDS